MLFVQLPVKLEHFGAAIDNASDLLTVVMGLETALMAVMRLDVVSLHVTTGNQLLVQKVWAVGNLQTYM